MPLRTFLPSTRLACLALLVIFQCFRPTYGDAADGPWKEKTQVVWSKDARTLVRQSFRVWDPYPELDLDFLWEPDPTTASSKNFGDIVNGPGTLTWYAKGAANYDRRFTYSVFKGVLKNGRPEGQGALGVRGGLSYTGQWVNGKMHGGGVLRFANGDKYEGDFVAGKMQGVGRYASTDGFIYLGEFRNGLRHGLGRLTLIDGNYRTIWRDGREIERRLIPPSGPGQPTEGVQLAATSNSVKLKLSLNKQAAVEFENRDPDANAQAFDADYAPTSMTIHLASTARLAAWKKNGSIPSGKEKGLSYLEYSWNFPPVFLTADLQNQATKAAEVTGAFLDVLESTLDPTPYVEVHQSENDWCDSDGTYNPVLDFQNFGWGEVRDARIIYSFGSTRKRTNETNIQIGSFEESRQVSIEGQLGKLGVDVEKLRKAGTDYRRNSTSDVEALDQYAFKCDGASDAEVAGCFERVKRSGVFGNLKDFVFRQKNDNIIYTIVTGRLEYQWTDSDGKSKTRISTFTIFVPLVRFNVAMAEMGCLDLMAQPNNAIALSLDRSHYRIPLPQDWSGTIGGTKIKRFNFSVSALKSSNHVFQLVLNLADGNEVRSPVVRLSYFRPRISKKWEQRQLEQQQQQEPEQQQQDQEQQRNQQQ